MSELTKTVRPLVNGIVAPRKYIDIVGISDKDESYNRVSSNGGNVNFNWEYTGINCNSFLDRKIPLEFQMDFTIAGGGGVPGGANMDVAGFRSQIALRYSPVLSTAQDIVITINNQRISYPANRFFEAMSRFNGGEANESMRLSAGPYFHDSGPYTNYDAAPPTIQGLGTTEFDPLDIGNITYSKRGNIRPSNVAINGNNLSFTFNWTEYIDLSPLTNWCKEQGFYNISSIAITIRPPADKSLYLSVKSTLANLVQAAPHGIVGVFDQANQVARFDVITPKFNPDPLAFKALPANNMSIIPLGSSGVLAPLANSGLTTFSNILLDKIPSKIFLFCYRNNNTFSSVQADTYGLITQLKINYAGKSSYFSEYTTYDLYEKFQYGKGFKAPYPIVKNYLGSVLCLEAQDFYDSMVAGSPCCTNIQISLAFQNLYGENQAFQVMAVIVNDAVAQYTRTTFSINDLVLDNAKIQEAALQEIKSVPSTILLPACKLGSGIKDDLMSALTTVLGGVEQALKFYSDHQVEIDELIEVIKELGISATEAVSLLFASGLKPEEVYSRLSLAYPQPELNKIFKSLKSAGCCCMEGYDMSSTVSMGNSTAGKTMRKKKAGVIITEQAEFDNYKPKKSLMERF